MPAVNGESPLDIYAFLCPVAHGDGLVSAVCSLNDGKVR